MNNCIFCKITEEKIPATKVYEDESTIGFKDLNPQAKIHLLFIHKRHTKDINDLTQNDPSQLKDLFSAISKFTIESDLALKRYRIVTNLGSDAGQTVFHTHLHVLGGETLGHFGA